MKHKVGDKVRIKSKAWWNAQPKNTSGSVDCGADTFTELMTDMCGKIVEIRDILKDTYFITGDHHNWTDEMFEDSTLDNAETPHISEQLIKDIAEVIKSHNLGVSVSESEGKLIIKPLKVEEEEDLSIDTPCMVADELDDWHFRYYAGKKKCVLYSLKNDCSYNTYEWNYIIPFDKFNPNDIEESLKYNINK